MIAQDSRPERGGSVFSDRTRRIRDMDGDKIPDFVTQGCGRSSRTTPPRIRMGPLFSISTDCFAYARLRCRAMCPTGHNRSCVGSSFHRGPPLGRPAIVTAPASARLFFGGIAQEDHPSSKPAWPSLASDAADHLPTSFQRCVVIAASMTPDWLCP